MRDIPGPPWAVWSGKPRGSVGKVEVVEQGSAFGGSRSVLLAGEVKGVAGPTLAAKFGTIIFSLIVIKFDFYIPASPGPGLLPNMTLGNAERKNGLILNMANQFISPDQGLKIAIRGKTLEKGQIIAPFRNDTWYHVEITTLKTQDGRQKFDVMVTPIGLSGLDFIDELEGFAGIEFGWNSNNPSGAIHVANFVVEDSP